MNVVTLLLGALLLPAGDSAFSGAMPAHPPRLIVAEPGHDSRRLARRDGPAVRLWISGDNVFRHGEEARVYFRADESAYVTIVRIDTDGRMRVLWPESPRDDGWIRGGRTERVSGRHGGWLRIDDDPGLGYVFAIASWDRFAFDRIRRYDEWDYQLTDYRAGGDPFIAIHDLAARIVYEDVTYTTDYVEYHVGRRYDYPHYACNECHRTGSGHWDPHARRCSRVYVIVWNDPYHHSHRYYRDYHHAEYERRTRYDFKTETAIERRTPASAIDRRQRTTMADMRRPGAPDGDLDRPTRGAGGSRPGGGTDLDGDRPENRDRRRGEAEGANGGGGSGGRIDAPRRDPSGNGGSGGGNGPRRDPPAGGNGGGNGNGGENGNGNGGGAGGGSAGGGGGSSGGHGRPRRDGNDDDSDSDSDSDGEDRGADNRRSPDERGSRGGAPRRDESDSRRGDVTPRGESPSRERSEAAGSRPRAESPSAEPRHSRSPERRSEPRRESSSERRSEPRRETTRSSRPSGSSRSSGSPSRRRP